MLAVETPVLHLAYERRGPANAPVALLLHGWPDSIRTWDAVVEGLLQAGYQTIAPAMRGSGDARFRDAGTMRSGQVTALAQDAVDLLDALGIDQATLIGHDWGARAGYLVAALWPERVKQLVSCSAGYEVGVKPGDKQAPDQIHAYFYQWFFHTERGHEALKNNREVFCRYLWQVWAPTFHPDDATFRETAKAWDNPDWVELTLHAYCVRWGAAPKDPRYDGLEARIADQPKITVPTTVLHGELDGASLVASSAGQERHFTGGYARRVLPGVGHFVPREAPEAVLAAVLVM